MTKLLSNRHVTPWVVTIGFFVLWELVCDVLHIDRFVLPKPSDVVASLGHNGTTVLLNALQTFYTTMLGFAVAVVVGLFLGLLVGASPAIYRGLYPLMVGLNSVPKVAVVPILVIWFGIGTIPATITALVISFFPIMVNVATGLATIEPELNDVLRSLGARKWQILRKIGIPRAMPYFFASLKVSIALAFIGSVVAETVAPDRGIGYLMISASARFDVPLVFAGLFVIALMGVVMYEVFAAIERRVTFWATRSNEMLTGHAKPPRGPHHHSRLASKGFAMLPKHGRYDYSVIEERPDYSWPDGKRLAFCVVTNLEVYAYRKGTGWDPAKLGEPQNQRNYSWRDYGNRVGIWRLFELFEQLGIPAAHNVNSLLYDDHPQIFARIRERGDEIVSHGRTNAERQDHLWELDERRLIDDVTQAITKAEGQPPKGWMGPAASESTVTPNLLKEAGYRYVMDWPADDQPFWLRTRSGPLLSVPYPAELNDSAQIIHRRATADQFADMIVAQFDEMVEQCVAKPLVLTISLHAFVVGQPFRLPSLRKALRHCVEHPHRDRVWWTTPGAVADHCCDLPAGIVPGSGPA